MENEKDTEAYLVKLVRSLGGRAYKFISPGIAGVPDRIVILPGNRICFVETKSQGRTSSPQQKKRQAELRAMGCTVYAEIDTKEKVREVIAHELADGIRLQAAPVSAPLHQPDS